ncbi:cation/H(+) antiporter 15 [Euphorbia lathyris]|uniref:cation/H(+) antiporter 15 n=1 Tax=Euphorbia lathyris TaxID=212925 RepID=UPI0033132FEC
MTDDKAFWKSENSLISSLPYFVIQLSIMMLLIRFLFLILKPLRQPRFLAELLSSILVGPAFLANTSWFPKYIHPAKTTKTLDTMGQLGLVYYMFLVGLEMDLTMLRHIEKKAMWNAGFGMLFPLGMGTCSYFLLTYLKGMDTAGMGGAVWAITLTVTSFSDLARVLSDMKLLHTEIGKLALSSALVSDLVAWALLVLSITMVNRHFYFMNVFAIILFVLLCWFAVRPALAWAIRLNNSYNGGMDYELLIYFILGGVVIFGLVTDACGSQSMFGAFMFGLIIPKGELGMRLMEKLEDLVTGILLPAFFWTNGLKIDFSTLKSPHYNIFMVIFVIILSCVSKVISAFVFSMAHGYPVREGIALGVLMNTKGVLALIILNAGRDMEGFDDPMFAIMTISLIIMTIMVKPIALAATKTSKQVRQYKRRTIEKSKQDSELRILACIHSVSNLSGIINLLEVSNPTKQSPIVVFALHLVQLTARRVSAMLIVHDAYHRAQTASGQESYSREIEESDHIITAFQNYENRSPAVSVQSLTVVSPYASMKEDVCRLAEEKRVNFILVPFHKQPDVYGKLQDEEDVSLRTVNQNLLATAPCSIGILIDRGLGESQAQNHFVMLFIGGADSREALAYAWRMAGSASVSLTVVRFLPSGDGVDDEEQALTDEERERKLDDEYINDFRYKTMYEQSISYAEMTVDSGHEIITALRRMHNGYDLYIVGKGQGAISQLTSGLLEWSDCEELGALGDTLLSSDFADTSSILIIQQHYIAKSAAKNANSNRPDYQQNPANWLSPLGISQ